MYSCKRKTKNYANPRSARLAMTMMKMTTDIPGAAFSMLLRTWPRLALESEEQISLLAAGGKGLVTLPMVGKPADIQQRHIFLQRNGHQSIDDDGYQSENKSLQMLD